MDGGLGEGWRHHSPADRSMEDVSAACAAETPMVNATGSLTGVSGLPEELIAFFPNLGLQVIGIVVANISDSQPHYSREQLTNACIDTLLQMSDDTNALHDVDADRSEMSDHTNALHVVDPDLFVDLAEPYLVALLTLDELQLLRVVKSLVVVMTLIDERPEHAHLRQLRKRSKMFADSVDGHRPALELLMLAGFEESELDGEAAIVFRGDPDTSFQFLTVKRALEKVYQRLATAVPAPSGGSEGRIRKRDRIKDFLTACVGGRKATRSAVTTSGTEVTRTSDVQKIPESSDERSTMNIELLELTSSGYVITLRPGSSSREDGSSQADIVRATALSCREEAQEALKDESLLGWSRSPGRRVTC